MNVKTLLTFLCTIMMCLHAKTCFAKPLEQNKYWLGKPCPRSQQQTFDQQMDRVSDWDSFYRAFVRLRHCDSGFMASGFTKKLMLFLNAKEPNLTRLHAISKRDVVFRDFLAYHLSNSFPDDFEARIGKYVVESCKPSNVVICKELKEYFDAARRRM
jgi:hypothetical protein